MPGTACANEFTWRKLFDRSSAVQKRVVALFWHWCREVMHELKMGCERSGRE